MINSNRFIFLILVFLVLQLPAFAQSGTSAREETPSQKESSAQKEAVKIKKLSQDAEVIITGKVRQKKSAWNENKTRIYTRTTLQVDEYLKGKISGNSLEVTSLGGEVGEVGELYTHMPTFEEKEEVLLFLKKDQKNTGYKVLNGEDGKITLFHNAKIKEKVTVSDIRINDLKSQIKSYIKDKQ